MMKSYLRYIVFCMSGILLYSCQFSREEDNVEDESGFMDTLDTGMAENTQNGDMIWSYDPAADTLKRVDTVQVHYAITDLVDIMNTKYHGRVRLETTAQYGDSVFVKIDSAVFLTQQMGSAGARAYLAEATYTLTESDSVAVVVFDFKEGDHAVPGIYTRETFVRKPQGTQDKQSR